jgi:hypothetical protein
MALFMANSQIDPCLEANSATLRDGISGSAFRANSARNSARDADTRGREIDAAARLPYRSTTREAPLDASNCVHYKGLSLRSEQAEDMSGCGAIVCREA